MHADSAREEQAAPAPGPSRAARTMPCQYLRALPAHVVTRGRTVPSRVSGKMSGHLGTATLLLTAGPSKNINAIRPLRPPRTSARKVSFTRLGEGLRGLTGCIAFVFP